MPQASMYALTPRPRQRPFAALGEAAPHALEIGQALGRGAHVQAQLPGHGQRISEFMNLFAPHLIHNIFISAGNFPKVD